MGGGSSIPEKLDRKGAEELCKTKGVPFPEAEFKSLDEVGYGLV
jgi:hypothetical protein